VGERRKVSDNKLAIFLKLKIPKEATDTGYCVGKVLEIFLLYFSECGRVIYLVELTCGARIFPLIGFATNRTYFPPRHADPSIRISCAINSNPTCFSISDVFFRNSAYFFLICISRVSFLENYLAITLAKPSKLCNCSTYGNPWTESVVIILMITSTTLLRLLLLELWLWWIQFSLF
jgi:hypothetical protein